MKELDTLIALGVQFAILSLFAIGGAMAVVPEMHRQAVDVAHWMTERQFADLFAIGQAAPGPNIIVVTLIGFKAAGIPGALTATLAMCGPTCVLTYYVSRTFDKYKDAHWRIVVQAGLIMVPDEERHLQGDRHRGVDVAEAKRWSNKVCTHDGLRDHARHRSHRLLDAL